MRNSKEGAAETRKRIVQAASAEFRRNGVDGTGLADLMAAAGLTHGGFYKHFESKDQVIEESVATAIASMVEAMERTASASPGKRGLRSVLDEYLSAEHRDDAAGGCPFVALGSEMARSSENVRMATTAGLLKVVEFIAGRLDGMPPAAARKEALLILSTIVGAVTLSRIVTDRELSASILKEARKHLAR